MLAISGSGDGPSSGPPQGIFRTSTWRSLAAVLMLFHAVVAWTLRAAPGSRDDLDRYWEIGSSTGRPYVSFQVEYAPLAPLLFKALARVADNRRTFRTAMVWTAATADVVAALALARGFGWSSAALYLAVTLPLLPLYYKRFDLLPTAAAAVGVAALRMRYPAFAASSLVVGIGFKLWPLPLIALVVHGRDRAVRHRGLLALLVSLAMLGLGWLVAGGLDGIRQVVTLRGAAGWHLESVVGAVVALWDHESLRMESDAWRVGRSSPTVTLALLLLATATSLCLAWRGATDEKRWGTTWLASVTAVLVCAPVLSPQYMAWIAPATALTWVEGNRTPAVLAAGAMALTVLLMREYDALLAGGIWALTLVIMRNTVLLFTLIAAAAALIRSNGDR